MDAVAPYVSTFFLLTTFTTVGIFLFGVRTAGRSLTASHRTAFLLALWIVFQSSITLSGLYLETNSKLPLIVTFGVFPAVPVFGLLLYWWSRSPVQLSLNLLAAIQLVRIPVAVTEYWLAGAGQLSSTMLVYGIDLDLVIGIVSLAIVMSGSRTGESFRNLQIGFNIVGICILVISIVVGVLSIPGSIQLFNIEQPNVAVLYFPYSFFATIVAPLLFFAHLESLRQLFAGSATNPAAAS